MTVVTVLYVSLYHDHFHKLLWFNFVFYFFVRINSKDWETKQYLEFIRKKKRK